MPVFQQRRPDLNEALKQGSKGAAGSRASRRVPRALLVAEVAISAAVEAVELTKRYNGLLNASACDRSWT